MAQSVVYLNFNGSCKEAMHFYQHCLGGQLELQTIGESPMASYMTHEPQHHILHSVLTSGNTTIMASDMVHGDKATSENGYSICLLCESETEINDLFDKLSEGGKVIEKITTTPWGALFAMLTDKYGKNWMFNYTLQQ